MVVSGEETIRTRLARDIARYDTRVLHWHSDAIPVLQSFVYGRDKDIDIKSEDGHLRSQTRTSEELMHSASRSDFIMCQVRSKVD